VCFEQGGEDESRSMVRSLVRDRSTGNGCDSSISERTASKNDEVAVQFGVRSVPSIDISDALDAVAKARFYRENYR